jgi:uracil-DNA glycosylase family 4
LKARESVKPQSQNENTLAMLHQEVIACRRCPRLVEYRERIAETKRRAFREWTYWGKPVPGFGDPHAQLLILGLAPAAHGGNRTGRVFTGDRSGDFLFRLLHRAGFANQPASTREGDGLRLRNAYIAATARCAPPGNKPLPSEAANCREYFERELELLKPRAILALGRIAWNAYLDLVKSRGLIASRATYPFSHGGIAELPAELPRLFGSYHPSQQNTQTGRLTDSMFLNVLMEIRSFLAR